MSETYSVSYTSTYTEARAVAVMTNAFEDIVVLVAARKISYDKAKSWREDLLFLAKKQVLRNFELQYSNNSTKIGGYKYAISDDGSLYENSQSGGIDPYNIPDGCKVNLFADVDFTKRNKNEVINYLESKGWRMDGSSLSGNEVYERSYSKDGYGLRRYKINL